MKLKYIKYHKSKNKGKQNKWNKYQLHFGTHGLKMLENCSITTKQLEAIRKLLVNKMNRQGRIWFLSLPNLPRTKKVLGDRMGKGKGNVDYFVYNI